LSWRTMQPQNRPHRNKQGVSVGSTKRWELPPVLTSVAKLGCGELCWGSCLARPASTPEDTSAEMCSSSNHKTCAYEEGTEMMRRYGDE